MKHNAKYESESNKNEANQQNTVTRRSYLKGLGTAAMLSGITVSGADTATASTSSGETLGYGEGGYGELGYGGLGDEDGKLV